MITSLSASYVHDRHAEDTYGAESATLDGQIVLMSLLFVLQRNHTWMAHMDYEVSCRRCTDTHHSDPSWIPAALLLTEGAASTTHAVKHTILDTQRVPGGVADEADSFATLQMLQPQLRNTGEFAWSGRTGVGDGKRYSTLAITNIFLHRKYLDTRHFPAYINYI